MNEILRIIKEDKKANDGNLEVIFFLVIFRLTGFFKEALKKYKLGILLFPVYFLFRVLYKLLSTIYVMEIPFNTNIGGGLAIYHLKGIVINENAIIGQNVTINHFVTIADLIEISDGVVINPLSVIVKGNIGENAVVGAGSIVTKDVPANAIVVGPAAKPIVKTR